MMVDASPRVTTSRRRVKYVKSTWRVHQFEIWSGEVLCRVAALQMKESLLVWVGGGVGDPALGEMALGMPGGPGDGARGPGLAASLLGHGEGHAASLARRLSIALQQPVYVACGSVFDRFTLPLVERGLITRLNSIILNRDEKQ